MQKTFLILIIFLAAILRFTSLGSIPIGFNDDEAAFGYNAYSILKTGRDEWGRLLPFPVFESFGDWKLVGCLYLTAASQFFLGTNEFATRFPSALLGLGAIISTYLLSRKLFDNKIALLSTFLLAVNPWHIIASRNAFESDILIFFITLATYFFLLGERAKKFYTFSVIIFAFCFYIYRSAWLFVPLFLVTLIYFNKKIIERNKPFFIKNSLLFILLLMPLIPAVFSFQGQSRFFQESYIFGIQRVGIVNEINEKRGACFEKSQALICQVLYNKYLSFATVYFSNYFENLSPQVLFTKSSAQGYQSYVDRGLLYSFELPALVLGIVFLIRSKNRTARILIAWILIVPLGASFTGVGNPGRLNILLPAPQIIEAFAIISLYRVLKKPLIKNTLVIGLTLTIIISTSRLVADMFFYNPQISGRYQRYGYKELFDYLENQKSNYDLIAVSRKNDDAKQYIHYLFFEKIDPNLFFDPNYTIKFRGQDKWQEVQQIGKIRFFASTPAVEILPPKSLLAIGEKEAFFPASPIYSVRYLNGDRAFEVYDVDQIKKSQGLINSQNDKF